MSSAEVAEEVVQNLMFMHPKFGRRARNFFFGGGGTFVNWHHFRPTSQVWLRSHGWSFVYADEMKK